MKKIEGKYAMRAVQNADLYYNRVFVPNSHVLPFEGFNQGPGKVLEESRLYIGWAAIGCMLGAYDNCMAYITQRVQFKKSISGF